MIQEAIKNIGQLTPEQQQNLNDLTDYALNAANFIGVESLAEPLA